MPIVTRGLGSNREGSLVVFGLGLSSASGAQQLEAIGNILGYQSSLLLRVVKDFSDVSVSASISSYCNNIKAASGNNGCFALIQSSNNRVVGNGSLAQIVLDSVSQSLYVGNLLSVGNVYGSQISRVNNVFFVDALAESVLDASSTANFNYRLASDVSSEALASSGINKVKINSSSVQAILSSVAASHRAANFTASPVIEISSASGQNRVLLPSSVVVTNCSQISRINQRFEIDSFLNIPTIANSSLVRLVSLYGNNYIAVDANYPEFVVIKNCLTNDIEIVLSISSTADISIIIPGHVSFEEILMGRASLGEIKLCQASINDEKYSGLLSVSSMAVSSAVLSDDIYAYCENDDVLINSLVINVLRVNNLVIGDQNG